MRPVSSFWQERRSVAVPSSEVANREGQPMFDQVQWERRYRFQNRSKCCASIRSGQNRCCPELMVSMTSCPSAVGNRVAVSFELAVEPQVDGIRQDRFRKDPVAA